LPFALQLRSCNDCRGAVKKEKARTTSGPLTQEFDSPFDQLPCGLVLLAPGSTGCHFHAWLFCAAGV
jgi:hypothetical protein